MHLHGFIGLGRKRLDVGVLAGLSFLGEQRVGLLMAQLVLATEGSIQ
jgi:hypothetical protein